MALVASPTPTPAPRIGAVTEGPRFAWSDKLGNRVAEISAESGAATGAGADDVAGEMKKARAILYQNGKPVATLTADKLQPDTRTRKITGSGNVRLVSRSTPDGIVSSVRADHMVWEYDRNQIHGTGNVLVTQGDLARIPGTAIDADTALQTVTMTGGSAPITGTIP
ncbi:MAG: LPS export ABC transporter periplasmic protein LptC [Fibrella sp.]|nr:LPS export ABC transporter periplasmic protein LptC [Armatimonadota bacterium]